MEDDEKLTTRTTISFTGVGQFDGNHHSGSRIREDTLIREIDHLQKENEKQKKELEKSAMYGKRLLVKNKQMKKKLKKYQLKLEESESQRYEELLKKYKELLMSCGRGEGREGGEKNDDIFETEIDILKSNQNNIINKCSSINKGKEKLDEKENIRIKLGKDDNNYIKVEKIGKGQFGIVWKGIDPQSGQLVAIKEVDIFGFEENVKNQLLKEVQLLKDLEPHPNIVSYIQGEIVDDKIVIITEYASSGTMQEFFLKIKDINDRVKVCKVYFSQTVWGLKHLHKNNIAHRDIKPNNLLIDKESGTSLVKIADFGCSRSCYSKVTKMTQGVGTKAYFAPEFIKCSKSERSKLDFEKIDIWALGISFIETLLGKYPFDIDDETELFKFLYELKGDTPSISFLDINLDKNLSDLINGCLKINPIERFSTDDLMNHDFFKC